jgi:hypothetical protein
MALPLAFCLSNLYALRSVAAEARSQAYAAPFVQRTAGDNNPSVSTGTTAFFGMQRRTREVTPMSRILVNPEKFAML